MNVQQRGVEFWASLGSEAGALRGLGGSCVGLFGRVATAAVVFLLFCGSAVWFGARAL